MRDAWTEGEFARRWDKENARRDNPDRGELIDLLVCLLAARCREGGWILDLGSGSGQIEEAIFERIPGIRVVGLDGSPAMMELARERLAAWPGRFEGIAGDLTEIGAVDFPHAPYAAVFCSQVLHEIPHAKKREVIERAYELLAPGGGFYVLDRIVPDFGGLAGDYEVVWNRLGRRVGLEDPMSFREYVEKYTDKGDHVAELGEQVGWLRAAGFRAAPLYLHYNRALIAARRP